VAGREIKQRIEKKRIGRREKDWQFCERRGERCFHEQDTKKKSLWLKKDFNLENGKKVRRGYMELRGGKNAERGSS